VSGTHRAPVSPGFRYTEWLLGIVGGISAFLGLFIVFADANQYVGIGGDFSWRVGDISAAWAYGLLVGGGLLLVIALGMVLYGWGRAREAKSYAEGIKDLIWHAGIFATVNAFIWLQDIAIGGGVEYAYWVTIPWAIALGIHAFMYYFSHERSERRIHRKQGEPLPH
jgi:hypothetical protein